MKKGIRFCFILTLFAITMAVWADIKLKQLPLSEAVMGDKAVTAEEKQKEITEVPYHQDGYDAIYPMLLSGGTRKQLETWNKLIANDFDKILNIYSFRPIPEPTPAQGNKVPTILQLGYEVKENSDQLFSVFYTAAFRSPYAAHPTDLIYTTNIDKKNNKRIRLEDYVKLDEKFIKEFRTWDFIPPEMDNEEINKAIREFISGFSDKELLQGFQAADQIGSANLYHIFSYRTPEKLGISIEVPNYLGDHVEFERNLSELKDFMIKIE